MMWMETMLNTWLSHPLAPKI